ncbi:hypothetical protein [Nocardioides coralli]|uniref:hypothetical protein n=1 Tax=Nocardioides coralli TaxID=2872154 RepID=UPI001CA42AE2|nr:hypothetical protein [Nocardioides coralli]QZY27871.1 hypothetical protein K6T13_10180 [Nocardioides coralli]
MSARTSLRVLAVATVVATGLTLAPPAHAESLTLDDGRDARPSPTDIRHVRVGHGVDNVKVRTTFPNLMKRGHATLSVFIDTDVDARGPEYGVVLPLFSGSDYVLLPMRNWRAAGGPVDCRYRARFAWRQDYVRVRFDRGCFEHADRVRIGLKMRDHFDGSHPIIDWLKGHRRWTRWLTTG